MRTWSNDATATLAQRQKMSWDFGRSRHFKNGNPENSLKRRANETQSEKQMDTVQDQLGELRAFLKGKLNSPPINEPVKSTVCCYRVRIDRCAAYLVFVFFSSPAKHVRQ